MGCVGLIDYGMGNLASVERAIRAAAPGIGVERVTWPDQLEGLDAVVLPGVGAFDAAMAALARTGMEGALAAYLRQGRPLLGICLGYQLLFEEGEEVGPPGSPGGAVRGLGWLPGRVRRLPQEAGVTVPHMGWNRLELTGVRAPFLGERTGATAGAGPYVYFAHSYYPEVRDPGLAVAWCTVEGEGGPGFRFAAAAWRESAGGVQWHPEKSGRTGLSMLASFVQWALVRRAAVAGAGAGGP